MQRERHAGTGRPRSDEFLRFCETFATILSNHRDDDMHRVGIALLPRHAPHTMPISIPRSAPIASVTRNRRNVCLQFVVPVD